MFTESDPDPSQNLLGSSFNHDRASFREFQPCKQTLLKTFHQTFLQVEEQALWEEFVIELNALNTREHN